MFNQGDKIKLVDGRDAIVVQAIVKGDYVRYYVVEGKELPKESPENWFIFGVSPDEIEQDFMSVVKSVLGA